MKDVPMDVDKLTAGPELDAVVVAKVFDGKVDHKWINWGSNRYVTCLWCGGQSRIDEGAILPKGCAIIPPFSTETAAAWVVLDRAGLSVGPIEFADSNETTSMWGAVDNTLHTVDKNEITKAETAPLAICRAALKIAQMRQQF